MILSDIEIQQVNKTCREKGSVGSNAVIPRLVSSWAKTQHSILDYGAGKSAIHTMELRKQGFNVTAWDVGANFNSPIHDLHALVKKYDIVYASNVINVQLNESMLRRTLNEIQGLLKTDGEFIFNYPRSPRKMSLKEDELLAIVADYFASAIKLEQNAYMVKLND